MNIKKLVFELEKSIDRLEKGLYPLHNSSWCANRINWLYKFRYISKEQMQNFCDRMMEVFKNERNY